MKEPGLARRVLRPSDCTLALALPDSLEVFERNRRRGGDFCSRFRFPEMYEDQVLKPLRSVLPRMMRMGVGIERNVTLDGFGEILSRGCIAVFLMAHQKTDEEERGWIELAEGFLPLESLIECIPPGDARIVDFAVCKARSLTALLSRHRPLCRARRGRRNVTPAIALYFYYAIFHHLYNGRMTYLEAVEKSVSGFRKKEHG